MERKGLNRRLNNRKFSIKANKNMKRQNNIRKLGNEN